MKRPDYQKEKPGCGHRPGREAPGKRERGTDDGRIWRFISNTRFPLVSPGERWVASSRESKFLRPEGHLMAIEKGRGCLGASSRHGGG